MDSEANKALVRRYLEMWNTGQVELADEVLAPTWIDHAHPEVTGPESVKHAVAQIRATFPDFHITLERIMAYLARPNNLHRLGMAPMSVPWLVLLSSEEGGDDQKRGLTLLPASFQGSPFQELCLLNVVNCSGGPNKPFWDLPIHLMTMISK